MGSLFFFYFLFIIFHCTVLAVKTRVSRGSALCAEPLHWQLNANKRACRVGLTKPLVCIFRLGSHCIFLSHLQHRYNGRPNALVVLVVLLRCSFFCWRLHSGRHCPNSSIHLLGIIKFGSVFSFLFFFFFLSLVVKQMVSGSRLLDQDSGEGDQPAGLTTE